MKKKVPVLLVAFAIMAFGILAWFYGYYNNKSNDNLPNLASIATMDKAEVNELLMGYRKIQLREVWEEPDETNSNEDVWVINERTSLVVSYNNKDKVVVCRFSTDLQDISVSVAEVGGGGAFELLGKNAETISQILSADSWVPDATNCASDYIVTYNGRTIYYHSECGTFNERLEQSNQSLRLSETDREIVNSIIKIEAQQPLNSIVNIVDRTKTEGLPYDMATEKFFEDGDNEYYFSGIYSHYVIVHYEDGSQENIVTALNAGRATIADLDMFEVDYIVRALDTENVKPSDETISQTEAEEIALNECKVNYDYVKAEFDTDKNAWNIGFWEDNAQIASQTILIDTTGKVLRIGYAE